MIWPALLLGFGLAQVFIQQHDVSHSTKLHFAIAAVFFGTIPVAIQFAVLLLEFSHLPWKYMPKLILHHLLMNILGDHGTAACFVAKLSCKLAPQLMVHMGNDIRHLSLRSTLAFKRHMLLNRAWLLLSAWMSRIVATSCVLLFLAYVYMSFALFSKDLMQILKGYFYYIICIFFVPVFLGLVDLGCYLSLRLVAAAAFSDAFSGKLHTERNSLVVWLEDQKNVNVFDDCRGKKVIFNWVYPYTLKAAMPMVLRDLDLLRLKLLIRLRERLSHGVTIGSESRNLERGNNVEERRLNLERALEREEKLSWAGLRTVNWELAFDREATLRWIVLDGKELVQELFQLEKLRLGLKRLEAKQPVQLREQSDQLSQEQSEEWRVQLEHSDSFQQVEPGVELPDSPEQAEQPLESHVLDLMVEHLNEEVEPVVEQPDSREQVEQPLESHALDLMVQREEHDLRTLERERLRMREWHRQSVTDSPSRFVGFVLLRSLWPRSDTYTSLRISTNLKDYVKDHYKTIVIFQIVLTIYVVAFVSPLLVVVNLLERKTEAPPSANTYEPQMWEIVRFCLQILGGVLISMWLLLTGLWLLTIVMLLSLRSLANNLPLVAWVIRELGRWDVHIHAFSRKVQWQIAFGWNKECASFRQVLIQANERVERESKDFRETVSWDPNTLRSYPQWPTCLRDMQKLQSLMVKEERKQSQDNLIVVKVIRDVRLEVEFYPDSRTQQMEYVITATCTQGSYLSKLYTETFEGHCDTAKASEFFKMMDILDDNTFVVKRQENNPLLLQVDKIFEIRAEHVVFPCESLDEIVKSILVDGKKLDAIHISGISYV